MGARTKEIESKTDTTKQLNFRRLRQEFAQAQLKDGKLLFEKGAVISCDTKKQKGSLIVEAQVKGQRANPHSCCLEFQLSDVTLLDSSCDCPQQFDCHHLAALLYFLEQQEVSTEGVKADKEKITVHRGAQAKLKLEAQGYAKAYDLMRQLLLPAESLTEQFHGQIVLSFSSAMVMNQRAWELQFAIKRSKSRMTLIQAPRQFLNSLSRCEPMLFGLERVVLGLNSFGVDAERILKLVRQEVYFFDKPEKEKGDKGQKSAYFDDDGFAKVLLECREASLHQAEHIEFYLDGFEKPLRFSENEASLVLKPLELEEPFQHFLMGLSIKAGAEEVPYPQARCVISNRSGVIFQECFYPFSDLVSRQKLLHLESLSQTVLPLKLMPCFVQEALPHLDAFVTTDLGAFKKVGNRLGKEDVRLKLDLNYEDGLLMAKVFYQYGDCFLPHSTKKLSEEIECALQFNDEIPHRRLSDEVTLVSQVLAGFVWDEKGQSYRLNGNRAIVNFVMSGLKKNLEKVITNVPSEISSKIKIAETSIQIDFSQSKHENKIAVRLHVDGVLDGVRVADLRDCLIAGRLFIVKQGHGKSSKVLDPTDDFDLSDIEVVTLDLGYIQRILPLLEELGFQKLGTSHLDAPLWAVLAVQNLLVQSEGVCVVVHDDVQKLLNQFQMRRDDVEEVYSAHFEEILRPYQKEGLSWLKLLKRYGLGGILADDMGLGKTLQTIALLSRVHLDDKESAPTLVVCPTSLVENWKDEIAQYEPRLKCALLQGNPDERREIIAKSKDIHVFVTSYGILQKDIEHLETLPFSYAILDEAQNIKNKETRTARAAKRLKSRMRLVLTGTPIENSLEDLWSLFDFLMPGFLGTWDRFSGAHLKPSLLQKSSLDRLKMKIAPFVMRRMKEDVLSDLPSITRRVVSCQLLEEQRDVYKNYTEKASEELARLVEKDGFEKSKMHVLATITRLKQICCHPKLVNEDKAKSAKYELFWELLESLIASKSRVVVFSQFTTMLNVMREDFDARGIRYLYLDGGSRNRQDTVKEFNADSEVSVFLVSLRAGGVGLNLVGADSVIHYDLWWNPAVENQATDRVWRMGQKRPVTSYKLVTKGTIEERIVQLQDGKKELIGDLVMSDEDVLSKLNWEDVLQLLKS